MFCVFLFFSLRGSIEHVIMVVLCRTKRVRIFVFFGRPHINNRTKSACVETIWIANIFPKFITLATHYMVRLWFMIIVQASGFCGVNAECDLLAAGHVCDIIYGNIFRKCWSRLLIGLWYLWHIYDFGFCRCIVTFRIVCFWLARVNLISNEIL